MTKLSRNYQRKCRPRTAKSLSSGEGIELASSVEKGERGGGGIKEDNGDDSCDCSVVTVRCDARSDTSVDF